jgi:hypothetical protein
MNYFCRFCRRIIRPTVVVPGACDGIDCQHGGREHIVYVRRDETFAEMMLPQPRREARARWPWDCAPDLPYPPRGSMAAFAEGLAAAMRMGTMQLRTED